MDKRQAIRRRTAEIQTYLNLLRSTRAPLRFVIFAQGRTGTWLLHDLLNAHPQIACDKEILQLPRLAPYAYVRARSHRPIAVYGFHVQVRQLLETQRRDPSRFLRTLHHAGWRIIYLQRHNILRQSLSSIIARRRRLWRTSNPAEVLQERFTIDLDELVDWLDRRRHYLQQEAQALQGLPHLSLTYEAHLMTAACHQTTIDRVFEFLDLPSVPVSSNLQRLSSDNLAGYIENYDALVERLSAGPYREYLP